MDNPVQMLIVKIMGLAIKRDVPFIVLQNPKYGRNFDDNIPDKGSWNDRYVATIGNAACTFDNFGADALTEVYASLRSQLETNEGAYETSSGAF